MFFNVTECSKILILQRLSFLLEACNIDVKTDKKGRKKMRIQGKYHYF